MVILMTMNDISSIADAKAHLSDLVARVGTHHERVTVTVHGRPTAVLVSIDDLESLEETIAILSDTEAMRALQVADAELARGEASQCVSDTRYRLTIAPQARRQLSESLPEAVAFAAYEFIIGPLLVNPLRVGKRLRPPLDDRHSARRGTYRVLYRVDEQTRTVVVTGVFARSDAYRPR